MPGKQSHSTEPTGTPGPASTTKEALFRIVYASVPTPHLTRAELAELSVQAARWNMEHDVTGVLWKHRRVIVQVLEGPVCTVRALFERIERDPRHRNVTVAVEEAIRERTYGRWGMKLVPADVDDTRAAAEAWIRTQLQVGNGRVSPLPVSVDSPRAFAALMEVLRRLLRMDQSVSNHETQ